MFRLDSLLAGAAAVLALAFTSLAAAAAAPVISNAHLPLVFERNQGQGPDPQAQYLAHAGSTTLLLGANGIRFTEPGRQNIQMNWEGGNSDVALAALKPLASYSSYYRGSDPKQWLTHVPHFGEVRYREVYPGIDLVFHGNQSQLEYDFVLAPNADPNRITLSFTGAANVMLDPNGDLVLKTAQGELRQQAPVLYQEINGHRHPVAGHYVQKPYHRIGFQSAAYDRAKPLTIDPILTYSTYFGGSSADSGTAVAVDGQGNLYLGGGTNSTDLPVTSGAAQSSVNNGPNYGGLSYNAYLAKFSPDGGTLLYCTYFGGQGRDGVTALAADAQGNVYATGFATSQNFPTTPGAYKSPAPMVLNDVFVIKLNPTGQLLYSTLLGGNEVNLQARAIAVGPSGIAYIAGTSYSAASGPDAFPTTPGAFQTVSLGGSDAFVTALNSTGTAAVYSTLLGGSGDDTGWGIVVDANGNATIAGSTRYQSNVSPPHVDFPVTPGVVQPLNASFQDAFVTRLNPSGSALVFSTFLGGTWDDIAYGIAADSAGNLYVTGATQSPDFPFTTGAYQTTPGAGFVTKLNSTATQLIYSTHFNPGSGQGSGNSRCCEGGSAIAVDAQGLASVVGTTANPAFPVTPGALQQYLPRTLNFSYYNYFQNAFLIRLNATGTALDYSTLFGGSSASLTIVARGTNTGDALALDASGNALIGGTTISTNMPVTSNAFQKVNKSDPQNSTLDAYLAKISLQPGSCSINVGVSSVSLPAAASMGSIPVTAPAGCPWSAYLDYVYAPQGIQGIPAITFNPPASGVGSGTINYSAGLNDSNRPLSATLTVAGITIPITQAASPCTYALDASTLTVSAGATTGAVKLSTPSGCTWTAVSNSPWLSVTNISGTDTALPAGTAGGNGTVQFSVAANTGVPRTGTITIGGLTYTVIQADGSGTCSFSVAPLSISVAAVTTSGSLAVTGQSGCPWTFNSNASWVTLSSTTAATAGNGTVSYTAAQNTGAARTAALTVAGQTVTLTQAAPAGYTTLVTDIGIFRSNGSGGVLWVRDRNGDGLFTGAPDTAVGVGVLGTSGDIPLIGDWNGSGTKKLGVYRPASLFAPGQGLFVLDYNGDEQYTTGVDKAFWLQPLEGDVPVVGRWNGGTKDQIGIFRSGVWYLDVNGDGTFAKTVILGQSGDVPVVGDWNGSGTTKVGVFRNGLWILDYNGNGQWDGPSTDKFFYLGQAGDTPIVGDWNGSGTTKAGVYRNGLWVLDYNGNFQWDGTGTDKALFNGTTGDTPILGDWTGDGKLKAGVFHQGTFFLDVMGDGSFSRLAFIGQAGDTPIAGKF